MITGINHVGLCVESIDRTLEELKPLGAEELDRTAYPELGQTSAIIRIGADLFELMEPIGTDGVVPRFLKNHGQGLHHVSLLCDDLNRETAELQSRGVRVLGEPDGAARMVFTHPKSTAGVVFEITDRAFEIIREEAGGDGA